MWKLKRETKARWACKKIISTGQKENFHLFGFFFKIPSVVPSLVFRFMNKKSILAVKYRSYFFEGGHSISPVDLKFKSAFRSPIKTPPCASVCQRRFGRTLSVARLCSAWWDTGDPWWGCWGGRLWVCWEMSTAALFQEGWNWGETKFLVLSCSEEWNLFQGWKELLLFKLN